MAIGITIIWIFTGVAMFAATAIITDMSRRERMKRHRQAVREIGLRKERQFVYIHRPEAPKTDSYSPKRGIINKGEYKCQTYR